MQSIQSLQSSPMLDGFESYSANAESSSSRRQRISMACQYCRHRKIRCCGGAPCRNCTRSSRVCEYAPVPEEVNRATREKKAVAKSVKPAGSPLSSTPKSSRLSAVVPSPMPAYSPYFLDAPTFEVPYVATAPAPSFPARPAHLSHRRTHSTPLYESAAWTQPPPAPLLNSPAQLESSSWMYNGWSSAPPVPSVEQPAPAPIAPYTPTHAFPSVLEQTPMHTAYLASQYPPMPMSTPMPSIPAMESSGYMYAPSTYTPDTTSSMQFSTPSHLRPPVQNFKGLTVQTMASPSPNMYSTPMMAYDYSATPPISPNNYYTPYSTPSMYSAGSASSSSSQSNTIYTPSPPAHASSPTLAPEVPQLVLRKPSEPLVGLGFGLGIGMGIGAGAGAPTIEHDVFYTPQLGSESYFPY